MIKLFEYNWQVRDDWFRWCEDVPEEELLKKRVGGIGSILYTLYHIVTVEYAWIMLDINGQPDNLVPYEECASLQQVIDLSRKYHRDVEPFVRAWTSEMESGIFTETDSDGKTVSYKHGEIMRHIIAHEIHHIGQLSIWAREIGKKPITANLIRRGLFDH